MKRSGYMICGAVGMLLLIFDGKTAVAGAQLGVEQCIKTVIPALFPFFFLSDLLIGSLWGRGGPLSDGFSGLFGVPKGSGSIVMCGFLGGYPVGARSVAKAFHAGQLTDWEAAHMLTFCSQPGPAFLFGMVAPWLGRGRDVWVLWGIILFSAWVVSLGTPGSSRVTAPAEEKAAVSSIASAVGVMGTVCGWIILFRVAGAFLTKWTLGQLPPTVQTALDGFLELSGGCIGLSKVPDAGTRFLLACGMLTFGGVCVTMQTVSALGPLSPRPYLLGKLLQAAIAMLLAVGYVLGIWWLAAIPFIFLLPVLLKKRVAFSGKTMYTREKSVRGLRDAVPKEN